MSEMAKCAAVWTQFLDFRKEVEAKFKTEILDVYKDRMKNSKRRRQVRNKKTKPNPQKASSVPSVQTSTGATKLTVTALPSIAEESGVSSSGPSNSSLTVRTSQRSAAKRATEITALQLKQTLSEKLRNPDLVKKRIVSNFSRGSVTASTSKASEVDFEKVDKLDMECSVVLNRCSDLVILDEVPPSDKIENDKTDCLVVPSQNCFKVPRVPARSSCLATSKVSLKKDTSIQGAISLPEKVPEEEMESEEGAKPTDELDGGKTLDKERNSPILPLVVEEKQQPAPVKAIEINDSIDMFNPLSASTKGSLGLEVEESLFKVPEKVVNVSKRAQDAPVKDNNELTASTASRPTRIRTKNKKYNEDEYFSDSSRSKKTTSTRIPIAVPDLVVTESTLMEPIVDESSIISKKGKKRKSESDESSSNKIVKLIKDPEDKEEVSKDKTGGSVLAVKSGGSTDSGKAEASSSRTPEPRTRTKILTKPTVNNLINLDVDPVDVETHVEPPQPESPSNELPIETPRPEHRMTRTRTRELNKKKANLLNPQQAKANMLKNTCGSDIKGKENKNAYLLKLMLSNEKRNKATPLATNNSLFSPSAKIFQSAQKLESKRMESSANKHGLKEDAARLKKQEIMKAQAEGAKRKREEREQRQLAHKQAVEKKEKERLVKLQREKEEKDKQVAQLKKMKEEQLLQKKQMTEALLKEAEERRLREEEAKQARIKKQEEEKRRLAEERLKQAEDAKKLHEMRLAQEAKEKEISMKAAEKIKKLKLKQNLVNVESYQLTPGKDEIPPKKPKNKDDYGLSDADSGDSTDDEKQPKKIIPKWATRSARMNEVIVQTKVHPDLLSAFFPLHVDMKTLESSNVRCRQRASSAVWDSPNYSQ